MLTVVFALAAIAILQRGMKDRRAAGWSGWKLNLVFGAICILSLMTFWNLDLNARNRLGRLRARAGSIIAATFPSGTPDSQNAARVYEQAFRSLGMKTDSKIIDWALPVCQWLGSDQEKQSTTRPSDAKIREILQANSLGLKQLRRAAAMEQCSFVGYWDSTDLVGVLLPQVSSMRTSAELLAADARMRATDGDMKGAIADVNAIFAMSEHITREPTMLTALVAIAVESRGVDTLEIVLAKCDSTASEPLSLRIDPLFSHGRMVSSALRGEEALGLSLLASWGDSEYHKIPKRYVPQVMIPLRRVFLMEDDIRGYNIAVREWQRLAAMPYHKSREQWNNLQQRLMEHRMGMLTASVLPAVSAYPARAAQGDALHNLARLAAAATAYRIKTGALPESLDKLTPEFIETIPSDPFDGKPVRIAHNSDGGAILYSVGPDLKDDGGKAFVKDKGTGDIVFRLARTK
jgi:hypothetical protein